MPCCSKRSLLLRSDRGDRGAAAVDFVLVAPLLLGVCLAVVHVGMWVITMTHTHRLAFDAARAGIAAPGGPAQVAAAARSQLSGRLPDDATSQVRITETAGSAAVVVDVAVPLRVLDWRSGVSAEVRAELPLEPR